MVLILPCKIHKKLPLSRFEDVNLEGVHSAVFSIQKRRKVFQQTTLPFKSSPPFRIVTKHRNPEDGYRYVVARGCDLKELLDKDWIFVSEYLESRVPQNLSKDLKLPWLLSQITAQVIEKIPDLSHHEHLVESEEEEEEEIGGAIGELEDKDSDVVESKYDTGCIRSQLVEELKVIENFKHNL